MRKETWPELLDSYLRHNDKKEYKYGKFDCVTFCAGFIGTITDTDILKGVRYSGPKSALAKLEKGGGLFALTQKQMDKAGYKEIVPAFARRGDIVGFMTEKHGETVGVCVGDKFASPGENELVYLPMSEAVKAWGVK